MTRKRFASLWDAIEDSATDAASMKLRAELANQIIERMHARKLTQAKARRADWCNSAARFRFDARPTEPILP